MFFLSERGMEVSQLSAAASSPAVHVESRVGSPRLRGLEPGPGGHGLCDACGAVEEASRRPSPLYSTSGGRLASSTSRLGLLASAHLSKEAIRVASAARKRPARSRVALGLRRRGERRRRDGMSRRRGATSEAVPVPMTAAVVPSGPPTGGRSPRPLKLREERVLPARRSSGAGEQQRSLRFPVCAPADQRRSKRKRARVSAHQDAPAMPRAGRPAGCWSDRRSSRGKSEWVRKTPSTALSNTRTCWSSFF